jgi:hypothetical protein
MYGETALCKHFYPEGQKKLILYEKDHNVPRNDEIRERDAWLNKYLGRPQ